MSKIKVKTCLTRPSFEMEHSKNSDTEKVFIFFGLEPKKLTHKKVIKLLEFLSDKYNTHLRFLKWSKHYSLECDYTNRDGSNNTCEALGKDLTTCVAKMCMRMSFDLDVFEIHKILKG